MRSRPWSRSTAKLLRRRRPRRTRRRAKPQRQEQDCQGFFGERLRRAGRYKSGFRGPTAGRGSSRPRCKGDSGVPFRTAAASDRNSALVDARLHAGRHRPGERHQVRVAADRASRPHLLRPARHQAGVDAGGQELRRGRWFPEEDPRGAVSAGTDAGRARSGRSLGLRSVSAARILIG